jgi:hypothetical protein
MKKKGHVTKPNPMAKVLTLGYYSAKSEKSKKIYDRKKIAGSNRSGDYSILRAA